MLDCYGPAARLAVEVDGSIHDDPARREADGQRERALAVLGVRVVRLVNREVLETLDIALARIADAVREGGG